MNRVVGTGIFVAPPVVLAITGSKGFSLVLWLVGGIIAWAGYENILTFPSPYYALLGYSADEVTSSLMVYLEYGIRFPLTGGELHYVS